MFRRIASLLVVVALVTTAGCVGGLPGSGGEGEPTAGGGDSGGAAGDGDSTGDGVSTGDATVANRTAVLADAGSYTATWSMRVTEGDAVVGDTGYTTAVDYGADRTHFRATTVSDGETASGWETYQADGVSYTRYGEGERASYTVGESAFTGTTPVDTTRFVTDSDVLSEFERTGTETYDGVTVTRYRLTERPAWVAAAQLSDGEVRWSSFTFEVLVDGDGLVRLERWTASGDDDQGVTHSVEFTSSVTGVGSTTVDEPSWVESARQQT